jgi:hypothetical protein
MALEFLGAGAKTAVGYGRFEEDIQQTEALKNSYAEQVKKQRKQKRQKARTQMSVEDAFRDTLIDPNISNKDKKLTLKFISKTKSEATKRSYIDKGANWDTIIDILLEEKMSVIQTWHRFNKGTTEAKAYKNLSPYLPHLIIYLGEEKSERVFYCQLSEKRHYDAGQVENFAIDYYQKQTIKPVKILVIGTKQSAWYSFLSIWYQQILGLELDDIETLSDEIFKLMEAEEDQSIVLSPPCLTRLNENLNPYDLELCFDSTLENRENFTNLGKEIQDFISKCNRRNPYVSHTG